MGYPKALLPLGGGTFVGRILQTLTEAGLTEARIVLGPDAGRIAPLLRREHVILLSNPDPGRGQISSMKIALSDLPPHCEGCLFWPVDQPAVSAQTVRKLVRLFGESGAMIAMPACSGKHGHPAVFRRDIWAELMRVPFEAGPKPVIAAHAAETALLACDEAATIEDVDTPEDYLRLTGMTLDQALDKGLRSGPG